MISKVALGDEQVPVLFMCVPFNPVKLIFNPLIKTLAP